MQWNIVNATILKHLFDTEACNDDYEIPPINAWDTLHQFSIYRVKSADIKLKN